VSSGAFDRSFAALPERRQCSVRRVFASIGWRAAGWGGPRWAGRRASGGADPRAGGDVAPLLRRRLPRLLPRRPARRRSRRGLPRGKPVAAVTWLPRRVGRAAPLAGEG